MSLSTQSLSLLSLQPVAIVSQDSTPQLEQFVVPFFVHPVAAWSGEAEIQIAAAAMAKSILIRFIRFI